MSANRSSPNASRVEEGLARINATVATWKAARPKPTARPPASAPDKMGALAELRRATEELESNLARLLETQQTAAARANALESQAMAAVQRGRTARPGLRSSTASLSLRGSSNSRQRRRSFEQYSLNVLWGSSSGPNEPESLYLSTMTEPPVACTRSAEQLRCASDDLLPGLVRRAADVRRQPDAAELTFAVEDDLLAHIARVLDAERQCCRFLHFTLDIPPAGDDIRLSLRGPAGTGAFLESLDPAFGAAPR